MSLLQHRRVCCGRECTSAKRQHTRTISPQCHSITNTLLFQEEHFQLGGSPYRKCKRWCSRARPLFFSKLYDPDNWIKFQREQLPWWHLYLGASALGGVTRYYLGGSVGIWSGRLRQLSEYVCGLTVSSLWSLPSISILSVQHSGRRTWGSLWAPQFCCTHLSSEPCFMKIYEVSSPTL